MNEPRRWLDAGSSASPEMRRLLEAADKPTAMRPEERARARNEIKALELRESIPLAHASLFRLGRMVVPALIILTLAALAGAAAAPFVSRLLGKGTSDEHIEHPIVMSSARSLRPLVPQRSTPIPEVLVEPPVPETPTATPLDVPEKPIQPIQLVLPVPPRPVLRRDELDAPTVKMTEQPHAPTQADPAPPVSNQGIAAELALIEEARAKVATNPAAALKLLDRHAREFPAGTTSFSRELLTIEALRAAGRGSEARSRALALLERARGKSWEGKAQQLVDSLP